MNTSAHLARFALAFLSLCYTVFLPGASLAASGLPPGSMGEAPSVGGSFVPLTVGDYFSCEIPADWSKDDYPPGIPLEEQKICGVILSKSATEQVPIRITLYYYGEGNSVHPSMELFIARQSRPRVVLVQGDRYGEVTDTVVSGRAAKTFERRRSEFVAPAPLLSDPPKDDSKVYERAEVIARQVPVIERFVVVPAGSGFYALCYSAPAALFREFLGKFERVTATFTARH